MLRNGDRCLQNKTRQILQPSSKSMQLCFDGPQFLRQPMTTWPTCEDFSGECMKEIRREWVQYHKKCETVPTAFDYFSGWKSLYRSVPNFLVYINKLRIFNIANFCHTPKISSFGKYNLKHSARRLNFWRSV